jgi:hypothetical protein
MFFAHTTPWLYKAFHLFLVFSGFQDQVLLLPVFRGLLVSMSCIVCIGLFPSLIHSVRNRSQTTSLIVQSLMILSIMMCGFVLMAHNDFARFIPISGQIISGHMFFTLAHTAVNQKKLLVYGPVWSLLFGCSAVIFPILASIAGPQTVGTVGIEKMQLIIFLGLGEMVGMLVFVLAQCVAFAGNLYENSVRYIVE